MNSCSQTGVRLTVEELLQNLCPQKEKEAMSQQGNMFSCHLDFAHGSSLTLLLWPLQSGRGAGLAAATSWAGIWLGSLQTCLSYIKINSLQRLFFSIRLIYFIPTIDFSKLKTSKLLIRFQYEADALCICNMHVYKLQGNVMHCSSLYLDQSESTSKSKCPTSSHRQYHSPAALHRLSRKIGSFIRFKAYHFLKSHISYIICC